MACSVEVNCLGALIGDAHCTNRVLDSLGLVWDEDRDLVLSWGCFFFFFSS